MNKRKTISALERYRDGRRNALQRLDEFLGSHSEGCYAEMIRAMRKAAFASVDELQKSGSGFQVLVLAGRVRRAEARFCGLMRFIAVKKGFLRACPKIKRGPE